MHSPARHRDRFPIPPHSSRFAVPALNLTMDSLLTPLFVALPSIFGLTPLSVAFTHFDGGVGVVFHFFRSLPICPSRVKALQTLFLSFFVLSWFQTRLLRTAPHSTLNCFLLTN